MEPFSWNVYSIEHFILKRKKRGNSFKPFRTHYLNFGSFDILFLKYPQAPPHIFYWCINSERNPKKDSYRLLTVERWDGQIVHKSCVINVSQQSRGRTYASGQQAYQFNLLPNLKKKKKKKDLNKRDNFTNQLDAQSGERCSCLSR